jgi:hypothetical protein
MEFILNYETLVTKLKKEFERSDNDFLEQIPFFILMAQRILSLKCKTLGFLDYADGDLQTNVSSYTYPPNWRNTASISFGSGDVYENYNILEKRSEEFCLYYIQDTATQGTPKYYADTKYGYFLIAPRPDQTYRFRLKFYKTMEPISETDSTNWLTNYAPDLLWVACKIQAALYLQNQPLVAQYTADLNDLLSGYQMEDAFRAVDQTSVTSKPSIPAMPQGAPQ